MGYGTPFEDILFKKKKIMEKTDSDFYLLLALSLFGSQTVQKEIWNVLKFLVINFIELLKSSVNKKVENMG